jgi:hypothetical protein
MQQERRGEWGAFRSATVTFNVGHPQLTVSGPANGVAKNGTATVTAQVVDATSTPYYQFIVNGQTVQAYSLKNSVTLKNLKPGTAQVLVESLGPAQFRNRQFWAARHATLTLTVPTPPVVAHPSIAVQNASVGTGVADTLTVSGAPAGAAVTWSVISNNAATGLISGTGDSATFVGTAAGTYTVQATVDGASATAEVVVYGAASGVTLSPATATVVADGEATDAVTLNVVDANGNPVTDFNGTVNVSATSGVTYLQNGTALTPVNGMVSVAVTNGTATLDVGKVSVPGLSIQLTPSGLTSSNGVSTAASVTYTPLTLTSAPQVATSLKIVGAPTYLDANTQGTETSPIAVVVEDQAGYPMLSGTESVEVNVSGPATLVNSTNGQLSLAYDGFAAPAGSANTSASFMLASEQGETGPITITATSPGLAAASASVQAVVAGVPAQMAATLSANSFAEGSAGITLNLQAEDAEGVPVNDTQPVSVLVTRQGSTTPASNILVNGQAASANTTVTLNSTGALAVTLADNGNGANAGTYTVTISPAPNAPYSFPSQTLTFTETAGALAGAAFTSPSNTLTVPITNPSATYTLQLQDAYGNALAQSGVKVEVYAVGSSTDNQAYGQATVNGSVTSPSTPITVTTNSQGQASVTLAAEGLPGAQWVLYAIVPVQSGVTSQLTSAPSAAMDVATEVAAHLTLSLQDATAGPDYQSTGYAQAGNTVDATVTVTNQYGAPQTGSQTVQLTIPAGLSGQEPAGATDTGNWTPGTSNTVTMTLNLNSSGQATIPLEAWTEGSAALTASIPNVSTPVSGQASIYVQAGAASQVGLFQSNGTAITSATPLTVAANSPVAVMVESTDLAGNPVPATGSEVIALSDSQGGSFRLTADGAPISSVTLPAGQTSMTLYYVNGTAGNDVPTASLEASQLTLTGSNTATVANGATLPITVTVADSSGNPVSGQTVTASVSSNVGTITPSAVSGSNGQATFTYTAPSSGSGTATVTLAIPNSTLTQTVTIQY